MQVISWLLLHYVSVAKDEDKRNIHCTMVMENSMEELPQKKKKNYHMM